MKPVMHEDHLQIHAFRLQPGQDLRKEIQAYAIEQNIEAGWIMTGVGSLTQTHLRFANRPDGVMAKGYFEIVSLAGTVSRHGVHLHLCISDSRGRTTGGHLLEENLVYTTAEIVIGECKELIFTREEDEETGWRELSVSRRE